MKKIIALVAAAVLSASAVFAENTLHLGFGIPISPLTLKEDDLDVDFSSVAYDFAFDFTHVADSGFTFKTGFDVGYASSTSDDLEEIFGDEDFGGLDFAFGIGLGGSPIHNEKMTLSILGDLGFRIQNISADLEVARGYEIEVGFTSVLFYVGPEVAFTFRFNDHIGLFGNFGIFYNAGVSTSEVDGEDEGSDLAAGFTFQPKLGVAISF